MSQLPIDVDAEAIFLDGAWYRREELGRKIKSMIDAGDFNVARPSAALEALSATLQRVRTMSFRLTPELADALTQLAGRTGSSVGHIVREAVTRLLADTGGQSLRRDDGARAAAPTAPEPQPPQAVVTPGPGALRLAGVDPAAAQPIELTRRVVTAPADADESAENRWFTQ